MVELKARKQYKVVEDDDEVNELTNDDLKKSSETKSDETSQTSNEVPYKVQIVWRNVIAMTILHVLAIKTYFDFAFSLDIKWWHFLIPDFIARLSAMGVLAGSHRLWSHRSYKAKLPLRVFLMVLQTMSLQNDIFDWCRDHRLHHKHSDTDADPYNARRGFFFSHIGWLLVRKHPEVIRKGKTIDLSDVWADPVVRFQRRFYIPLVILLWGILPTYLCHWCTGLPLLESFFGAVLFRYTISLHYAWLVNSAAHLYGYQMYDKNLEPRENRLVVYSSMGEGYHNYHHSFPWDYSASEHGWGKCFNPATAFIDFFAWIGQAYDMKKADSSLVKRRMDRTGDIQQKQQFFFMSSAMDWTVGILSSYGFMFLTWIIRYFVNGKL